MVEAFIRERGVTVCPPRTVDWSHKATANGHDTPDNFLFRTDGPVKTPEQKLAAAKILMMLRDLAGVSPHESNPLYRERYRALAHHWFFSSGQDFEAWCEMAGFHPATVRIKAKNLLDNGWPQWRARAGKGSRYEERKAYRARSKQRRHQ
jgi:hypothetical protein